MLKDRIIEGTFKNGKPFGKCEERILGKEIYTGGFVDGE